VRFGNLAKFLQLEAATKGWWFPTLDRGAGALIHFAVDHGRLNMVKYLVEQRQVPVNQRDRTKGWTPLHRCAYVAHYHHAPYFDIFEYLLSVGADPSLRAYPQRQGDSVPLGRQALDLVVKKGAGWEEAQVRARLQNLVDKYAKTPKMPEYVHDGPPLGK
jgi:ankyrin repeat protein